MLEVLQNFEQAAARLSPVVLIAPGLAAVIIGLFIWLGGLGFRRLLVAAAGAVTGAALGFFVIGRSFNTAVALACVAAVLAVVFEKVFMVILAAILAAAIAFVIVARPYAGTFREDSPKTSAGLQRYSLRSSLGVMQSYSVDLGDKTGHVFSRIPPLNWGIVALAAVAVIVGGLLLWRAVSAFCCAALGTTLIFAGMISLLLFKGSSPITAVYNRPSLYGATFAAMTVFGTIEQLLFYRRKKQPKAKKRARGDRAESGPKRQSWRTT
ncbi:MAG: hypothetical protein JSU94_20235 [Phycisphaerales bacterium]|nr:MAG: hypothetical protein JSU94_20235 [Phycisphaerales bacterium]